MYFSRKYEILQLTSDLGSKIANITANKINDYHHYHAKQL
jgi:hypothetical protein